MSQSAGSTGTDRVESGTVRYGPVRLSDHAHAVLWPADRASITGGFWRGWQRRNATVSIAAGAAHLEDGGNLHNLRAAAGREPTRDYRGAWPFLDSEVYKWLEAAGWVLADESQLSADEARELTALVADVTDVLQAAQESDGYLQSYFQLRRPGERFVDLPWGHELYSAGHLIQAGIAHLRGTGRGELLAVGRRFADLIDAEFGPAGRRSGVDGHPEVESALVELYRESGDRRYLDLAGTQIDKRGYGLLGECRYGRAYWQDHEPIRQAARVAGHAVRQVYLLSGVVDAYLETGDRPLLTSAERLWDDMVSTKTYLTGGIGAHHEDEAFGDAYELPADRAYCETCAGIGSVMLAWRLLLATGDARYADLIERALYNAVLPGVSLDGSMFRYANPLRIHAGSVATTGDHTARRTPWFGCACCPPNVMRILASLQHYLVAQRADEMVLHQYATGTYRAGEAEVRVRTDYPWDGGIELEVAGVPAAPWTLTLRVPGWCRDATAAVNGGPVDVAASDGWLRLTRSWRPGDRVRLDLPMPPRLTTPHPRVDAVRGSVAVERGPLVYAFEQLDQPVGVSLDDARVDTTVPLEVARRAGELGELVTVTCAVTSVPPADRPGGWPYGSLPRATPVGGGDGGAGAGGGPNGAGAGGGTGAGAATADTVVTGTATAVPFYAVANRAPTAARVWLPYRADGTPPGTTG